MWSLRWDLVRWDWRPYEKWRLESRHSGKSGWRYKPRRETSEETEPVNTLIWEFQPPELEANKCMLLKPLSLWFFFLMAAQADWDKKKGDGVWNLAQKGTYRSCRSKAMRLSQRGTLYCHSSVDLAWSSGEKTCLETWDWVQLSAFLLAHHVTSPWGSASSPA